MKICSVDLRSKFGSNFSLEVFVSLISLVKIAPFDGIQNSFEIAKSLPFGGSRKMKFVIFLLHFSVGQISGSLGGSDLSNVNPAALTGLLNGGLVYVDCQITSMCAFMSETWLESEGIFESDTPFLTLADPSCAATDLGELEGLGDEHFWLWCSREFTAEEEAEHEEEEGHEPDGLAHYNCGTDTGVRSSSA